MMRPRYFILLLPIFIPLIVTATAPSRKGLLDDLIRENLALTRQKMEILDREPSRYTWIEADIKENCGIRPYVPDSFPIKIKQVPEKYKVFTGDDPAYSKVQEWRRLSQQIAELEAKNRLSQQLEMTLDSCKAALAD